MLKDRLRSDLTASMRARDSVRTRTIRAVLAAVQVEESVGTAHDLTDPELVTVVTKEAKKRREAATAYDDAKRPELAEAERAELAVLEAYLPSQLSDDELTTIVAEEIDKAGVTGKAGLGVVMKAVRPRVAGQAEGGRVAAEVRRQLGA